MTKEDNSISFQKHNLKSKQYTLENAIQEFEELKNIALSCLDKNGNPNISAAMRAVENKAKIAGLYQKAPPQIANVVQMGEIRIDGDQLKLKIGEEINQ